MAPSDLIEWPREVRPTEEESDAAAWVVLNRLRAGRKDVGAVVFRFSQVLVDDGALSGEEQRDGRLLRAQVGSDGVFKFSEVKRALKLPAVKGLRFLAKLEAAGWLVEVSAGATPLPGPMKKERRKRVAPARNRLVCVQELDADMTGRLRSLRWVESVRANDLRLWHDSGSSLEALLKDSTGERGEGTDQELCRAVARAELNTFRDEVQDVAICLASFRRGGRLVNESDRWVRIFVERYVSGEGPGKTLEEVGKLFGLTRERVRQVCAKMLDARDGIDVCMPATARVLAAARRAAPNSAEAMNAQLARILGDAAGIEAAMNFAVEMDLGEVPVVRRESRLRVGDGYQFSATIEAANEAPWGTHAFTAARREINLMGCTNLMHLAGALALEHKIAPGREALVAVVENAPGFRWLDKEGGWFTLGNGGATSGAASRIRKLMAVAQKPVNVDEIATALITDDLWLSREREHGAAVPPLHVQRELLYGWPWLRSLQKNRFTPTVAIDEDVLSDIEKLFVAIIETNGGVAARHQLVPPIRDKLGITDMGVNAQLGASPVIVKHEHGLYGLIGRTIEDGALERARTRMREKMGLVSGGGGEWGKGFRVRVTEASLGHEQYQIPERFRAMLKPGSVRVEGSERELWISPSYVLRRLKEVLPAVRAGDTCWIEVKDEGTVAVDIDDVAHEAVMPEPGSSAG